MTERHAAAILAETDAVTAGRWRSLAPGRGAPRSLVSLGEAAMDGAPAATHDAITRALRAVALAVVEHFPENVFCDLDAIAGALRREALRSARAVEETGALLVELHALYGRATTLRFRYVHDFLYGFDWARWVAAAPNERSGEPPFGRVFLERSLRRGRELAVLIEKDDPKYGRLLPGEARSPFPFRRDPAAEIAILSALAAEGAIPVGAWDLEPPLAWSRPFVRLREEKASELGLDLPR